MEVIEDVISLKHFDGGGGAYAAGWVGDAFYGGVLVIAVLITTLIRRNRAR